MREKMKEKTSDIYIKVEKERNLERENGRKITENKHGQIEENKGNQKEQKRNRTWVEQIEMANTLITAKMG